MRNILSQFVMGYKIPNFFCDVTFIDEVGFIAKSVTELVTEF